MTKVVSCLLIALVALTGAACNPFAPEEPQLPPVTNINFQIQNNNTNNNNNGVPGSTNPAPGQGQTDKVITSLKCTESGGDAQREFSVGENLTLTCTPKNAAQEDPCEGVDLATCGAYKAGDVEWVYVSGVSTDSTGVVQARGTWSSGFNHDFKALKAGSFTVRGLFKGGKARGGFESDFIGTVK